MKIVSVILLKKGLLSSDLSYFTNLEIKIGQIVLVPVRNEKKIALVTGIKELKDAKIDIKKIGFNLKKIAEIKGVSIFDERFLESALLTSKYFVQDRGSTLTTLIPNFFIENYEKMSKIIDFNIDFQNGQKNETNLKVEKLLFQYRTEDRISIYKTIIRESFARGKSIFIVFPTQFDIENFSEQLSKGIEQFTFCLHGGLSAKKKILLVEKILKSTHSILILATPQFLSIPRKDISTIILEHESSTAYKTIGKPYLDYRTFVEIFASKINAKLILADELLRYETIARKETENMSVLYPLSFRIDYNGEIEIRSKNTEKGKKYEIFNSEINKEIKFRLENKENIFIFSLRKGLATITVCRDCGESLSCNNCGNTLVLYLSQSNKKRVFVCNRCEKELNSDILCPNCNSWNLAPLGIGTDTVFEEIRKNFPKNNLFRLDKESTKTQAQAKKNISSFIKNKSSILIGTEMVFYYLKNKIPLSIIASFDSLWNIPNYKMGEKIIQIVMSMLRITGEKLIIQTKNKEDVLIQAIKSQNLLSLIREELAIRKKLEYPPNKRFIKISFLGNKEQVNNAKKILAEEFIQYSPEIFSGFVPNLKEKYAVNALIKLNPYRWSTSEILENSIIDEELYNKLSSLSQSFQILVDPEDLL